MNDKVDGHFLTFRISWKLYLNKDLKDKRKLFTFECVGPGRIIEAVRMVEWMPGKNLLDMLEVNKYNYFLCDHCIPWIIVLAEFLHLTIS